jgi:ribose-phosphate pyrophosphokinase
MMTCARLSIDGPRARWQDSRSFFRIQLATEPPQDRRSISVVAPVPSCHSSLRFSVRFFLLSKTRSVVLKALTIFSGNANRDLARGVCNFVETPLGHAEVTRFADGEVYVEIKENVRGVNCFVVQPTCAPVNDNLMELLVMIDALKRASAGSIVAVIPYFGYARQDRKSKPRTPISARLVADLLTAAGVNRVLAIDLHAGQIQGFFNIPVDHVYAMPVLMDHLRTQFNSDAVIVSPDAGGVERARAYSKRLGASLAIIDKRRPAPNVSEVVNIIGDVRGRDAIIVDDMVDTAGTLCAAAQAVMDKGARAVFACASHGVLSNPALQRITASPLQELIITDTVPPREDVRACPKIKVLSVAKLLGEAVKRIHHGDSISSLFI